MPGAAQLFATTLETALNAWLRLDPGNQQKLNSLQQTIIAIELRELDGILYLQTTQGGLRIKTSIQQPIAAHIRTGLWQLWQLANNQHVTPGSLEISGDTEVAAAVQKLFRDIDIDWEELLSHVVGDIAAHQIGSKIRAGQRWANTAKQSLLRNTGEYLQYEHNDLPSRHAVDSFLQAVDALRDDTERLSARIIRLQQRYQADHKL